MTSVKETQRGKTDPYLLFSKQMQQVRGQKIIRQLTISWL